MDLNYRRGQLKEIQKAQLIKLEGTTSHNSEHMGCPKKNKRPTFQKSLTEEMARMLQQAY